MTVHEIMTSPATTCHAYDDLGTVAHRMWEADLGSVAVLDDKERLVGMLTDRDLCMAAHLQGRRLNEIVSAEVMAHQVVSCRDSATIDDVLALMTNHQIHRVPVVDAARHVIGIVTASDLIRAARGDRAAAVKVVACLASIRAPRQGATAATA